MSAADIDDYLATVPEPQRTTLQSLRTTLRAALPGAEECISYAVPTFKVDGIGVAGFAAYRKHCSYFPMSGGVLSTLTDELAEYQTTQGSLHFPLDTPLPARLVRRLVAVRRQEIAAKAEARTP